MPGYLVKTANFVAEIGNDEELSHLAEVDTIKKDTQICVLPGKTWIEAKKLPLLRKVWGLDASGSVPPPIRLNEGAPKAPVKTSLPPPIVTTIDSNPLFRNGELLRDSSDVVDLTADAVLEESIEPPKPPAANVVHVPAENNADAGISSDFQAIVSDLLVAVDDTEDETNVIRSTMRGMSRHTYQYESGSTNNIEGVSNTWAVADATSKHEVSDASHHEQDDNAQDLDNVLDYVAVVENEEDVGDETRIDLANPHERIDLAGNSEESNLSQSNASESHPTGDVDSQGNARCIRDVSQEIFARMREMSELSDEIPQASPNESTFVIESDRVSEDRIEKSPSGCAEGECSSIEIEAPSPSESVDLSSHSVSDDLNSSSGQPIKREVTSPMHSHDPGANGEDEIETVRDFVPSFYQPASDLPPEDGVSQVQVSGASEMPGASAAMRPTEPEFDISAVETHRTIPENEIAPEMMAMPAQSGNHGAEPKPTMPLLDTISPEISANSIDALSQELVESIPGSNHVEEELTHPITVSSMFNHQVGGSALPEELSDFLPGAGDSIDLAFMNIMPNLGKEAEREDPETLPLKQPKLSDIMAEFMPDSMTSDVIEEGDLFTKNPGEVSQLQTLKMQNKDLEKESVKPSDSRQVEAAVVSEPEAPAASDSSEQVRPRSRFKKITHRGRLGSMELDHAHAHSNPDVDNMPTGDFPDISQELKAARAAVEAAQRAASENGKLDKVILERAASLVEALETAQKRSLSGIMPVVREHDEIKVNPEDDENPSDIFRIRRRGDVDLRYREEFHRISLENAPTTKYRPGKEPPPSNRDVFSNVDDDISSSDKFRVRGRSELRRMLEAEAKAAQNENHLAGVPISTEDFSRSPQGELRRLFEKEDELHLVLANEIRDKELEVESKLQGDEKQDRGMKGRITPPLPQSVSVTSSLPKRRNSVVAIAATPKTVEATHVTAAYGTDTSQLTFDSPFFKDKLAEGERTISRFGNLFLTSRRLWRVDGKKENVKNYVAFDIENVQSLSIHEERRYLFIILDFLLLLAMGAGVYYSMMMCTGEMCTKLSFICACVGFLALIEFPILWILSYRRYIQFGMGTNVLNAKITPKSKQDAMKFLNAVDAARMERRKELEK
ncbi:MAG: hypothetical protein J6A01_05355 [Proteobacteria bacterium]|nr:hypothetical protein [Pseudomonadota bacterium]